MVILQKNWLLHKLLKQILLNREMQKTLILFIGFFLYCAEISANPKDSISTYYKNSEFISHSQIWVEAPKDIMNDVIDDFIYQTKYDLNGLFKWALKDMKLRKEKDDIIVFNFKSTKYDEKSATIKATGDVEVTNVMSFPEVHVNSKMTKTNLADGQVLVNIDVLYSDAFLKKTTGVFRMTPKNNKGCWLTLETKVQFGWFFNIFITQVSYKYIMEWRFKKMMQNIKAEAERRNTLKQN